MTEIWVKFIPILIKFLLFYKVKIHMNWIVFWIYKWILDLKNTILIFISDLLTCVIVDFCRIRWLDFKNKSRYLVMSEIKSINENSFE